MPAIDFPAAPAVNDEYSFEGRTWRWNGTGWEVKEYPAALLAGTAANPSLYFSGDPNTGLYSPGADQVAISTGGTGRLFVDSAGNVGIGTSAPNGDFEVQSKTTGTDAVISLTAAGTRRYQLKALTTVGAFAIVDESLATERLRIDSTGNVGIGTSSPNEKLDVFAGSLSVGSEYVATVNTNYKIRLRSVGAATNNNYLVEIGATGSGPQPADSDLTLATQTWNGSAYVTTEKARLTATGRLGIGTVSPGYSLDVRPTGLGLARVGSQDSQAGLYMSSGSATSPFINFLTSTSTLRATIYAGASSDDLIFGTGASGTERARIDSSGRLLVGTSTTSQTTTVLLQGNSNTSAGNAALYLARGSATPADGNGLGQISFSDSGHVSAVNIIAARDGGTWTSGTSQPSRLVFSTTADGAASPTEQLRITNGGTVVYNQPAPAAVNTTATLTVANLTAKIITSTTAAAVTMTLPTGTDMDAGFSGLYTNMAFEWSVINTGATNAVTVQGGTGHTVVGSGTVAASNSGRFVSRRTAATTWVSYRLSS